MCSTIRHHHHPNNITADKECNSGIKLKKQDLSHACD